jgi:hypothetical protein
MVNDFHPPFTAYHLPLFTLPLLPVLRPEPILDLISWWI